MRTNRTWLAALVFVAVLGAATTVAAQSGTEARLTPAQLALACAPPPVVERVPANARHVIGGQSVEPRTLFGSQDLVVLDGGSKAGLALGQRFYIRRPYSFRQYQPDELHEIHTAGWLSIVAIDDQTAIGRIDHSCEGIMAGDFLEPFVAPVVPPAVPAGDLDFSMLGRVVYGDEQHRLAGAGSFMLVDRGTSSGVAVGQHFGVYRDFRQPGLPLTEIGEGEIVSASPYLSVLRVVNSRGSVESGDYVVPRKMP
jgi:hypothetical protein